MKTKRKAGPRRKRALETRRRILVAGYELFRARGYTNTTMSAIAKKAGVAVQTLYFTFGTKAALLEEVVGAAVSGFDVWEPPSEPLILGDLAVLRKYHHWFEPFEAAQTAPEALGVFVDGGAEIMERAAPLVPTMREAVGDSAVRSVYEIGEVRRADAYKAVVRILAKKPPGLRRGVTIERATDVALAVFSAEVYQLLRERGWNPREVRAFLLDALTWQLLGPR